MNALNLNKYIDSSSEAYIIYTRERIAHEWGAICLKNTRSSEFVPLKSFMQVESISPYAKPYPLYSLYEKYPEIIN